MHTSCRGRIWDMHSHLQFLPPDIAKEIWTFKWDWSSLIKWEWCVINFKVFIVDNYRYFLCLNLTLPERKVYSLHSLHQWAQTGLYCYNGALDTRCIKRCRRELSIVWWVVYFLYTSGMKQPRTQYTLFRS